MKLRTSYLLPLLGIFFLSLTSLTVLAGKESSGGGSAVACFRDRAVADAVIAQKGMVTNEQLDAIDSIELLDLFEWKRPRGLDGRRNLELVEPQPGEKFSDLLHRVIGRAFHTVATHSSSRLSGVGNFLWSSEFNLNWGNGENVIWTGTSLVNLQDEGTPLRFGGNCTLVPMAVQTGEKYDLRIFIDDRLFFHPKHSEQSRTALFVHEILYAMARELGQTDSSATRQAVGYIMVNDSRATIVSVLEKLNGLGFQSPYQGLRKVGTYSGLHLVSLLAYHSLYSRDDLRSFWLNTNQSWTKNGRPEQAVLDETRTLLSRSEIRVPETGEVWFVANDALAYLRLAPPSAAKEKLEQELRTIVAARVESVRKMFVRGLEEKGKSIYQSMSHISYVQETEKAALAKLLAQTFADQAVALASNTFTQAEIKELKSNQKEFAFPFYSFADLFSDSNTDEFIHRFYGATEIILRTINKNYNVISLHKMPMPLL